MSTDLYRARKRIKAAILDSQLRDHEVQGAEALRTAIYVRAGLQLALNLIDEELEADGEREFLRPIKPRDPIVSYVNAIAGQGIPRGVAAPV